MHFFKLFTAHSAIHGKAKKRARDDDGGDGMSDMHTRKLQKQTAPGGGGGGDSKTHKGRALVSDGDATVHVLVLGVAALQQCVRVHRAMLKVKHIANHKDAEPNTPTWYPHRSAWGLTKRRIMTLGSSYGFSGNKYPSAPFSSIDGVTELAATLSSVFGVELGMAHCNWYDQKTKAQISYHSDDEGDLLENGPIVCLSFGSPMRLQLAPKPPKGNTAKTSVSHLCTHMTAYVMDGTTQKKYVHRVVCATKKQQQAKQFTERISVTFRALAVSKN